jgi:hypothetical protein
MARSAVVEIDAALTYPAPVADVYAMMIDQEYLATKLVAMAALDHDVSVTTAPDGTATIKLRRVLPAVVPEVARPFVGETLTLLQTDTWAPAAADGSHEGRLEAEIERAPVSVRGIMRLYENADGHTVQEVRAEIKARIPLVGGKIEQAAAQALFMAVRKEEQVGTEWLTARQ